MRRSPLPFHTSKLRAIVATPARNEVAWLPSFFRALGAQTDRQGAPLDRDAFTLLLLVNNSDDKSADVARALARKAPFKVIVVEVQLPPEDSHAGGARSWAMDLAAHHLRHCGQGVILTTDADSQVGPTWIQANLDAFAQGADAVLGTIALDKDGELLPDMLHARGACEAIYERLLAEIAARLDPEDCNPWPHHATISGASLAVTLDMYRQVGGMPRVPLGEDKAFVAVLRRHDARIRAALDVHVVTSGRTIGRAPGGVADTLRLRSSDPSALCDEALEPLMTAFRRALWRGRMRREGANSLRRGMSALQLPASAGEQVLAASTFGAAWGTVERLSPVLRRRCLRPTDLPMQIRRAERVLRSLDRLEEGEKTNAFDLAAQLFGQAAVALTSAGEINAFSSA